MVKQSLTRAKKIPWSHFGDWLAGNRLRILMYHSISELSSDPHAVSPTHFAKQMEWLVGRNYQVVPLLEGIERLKQQKPLRKLVVITFDDALADFIPGALPVLSRHSFPATLFVPTGLIGKTAEWDSYNKTKPILTAEQLQSLNEY